MKHKSSITYIGIEPFADNASIFQRKLDAVNGVNCSVIAGEWPRCVSELPTNQFDVIFFVHSLYHVVNVNEALNEALHLLKPQGQLIVLIVSFKKIRYAALCSM